MATASYLLNRYALIGDVGVRARYVIKRALWPIATILAVELAILGLSADPATACFFLIGLGCILALAVWANFGEGLPILPLLALENLVAYALPIAMHNENVVTYSADQLTSAGIEVFLSSVAMALTWRATMIMMNPASALCYALQGFDQKAGKLARLAFTLVVLSTSYEILRSAGVLNIFLALLPSGSDSILHVLTSAASACGFFLSGMMLGRNEVSRYQRLMFWVCLSAQCFIVASDFLLSSIVTIIFAAIIGLFWGSGKVPWRFVIVTFTILSFLNVGKFVMRERYWGENGVDRAPQFSLTEMPAHYSEWITSSFDVLTQSAPEKARANFNGFGQTPDTAPTKQTLLERINNLQNLLYVIDVMESRHIKPLDGATYTLIPPLLVPRILWPNKPRTHEGQILLNVHFGRQDLNSTFETYIAWGLLPEAYGNFGPRVGGIVLGAFLGFSFAWLERFLARKLLLSMEGFLAFTVFLGMANSYEMVASVLVTSVFQACIPIVLASAPFVERIIPNRGASTGRSTHEASP